jgi:hypothetical protein
MSLQVCLGTFLALFILVPITAKAAPQSAGSRRVTKTVPATCPVTLPRRAPSAAQGLFGAGAAHWNGALFVGGLWPDGTVVFHPGGPGFILPDGSLSMKFGWLRGADLRGKLTVHGKRLDASAPPLRADIPKGYGDTGFQASALIFPTEGCWEITGEVGDTRVTFVTRVNLTWQTVPKPDRLRCCGLNHHFRQAPSPGHVDENEVSLSR